MAISKLNPIEGGIPYGNTAGRPTAATGKLYSNGETARLELYTSTGEWANIVQEVPGVSSITGTYNESTGSATIIINGTNFVSGGIASATGTNGVEIQASSTTFNSLVQLSAVFTGLSNANEPYDIKVTNPSNLFGLLPDALYINASPVWTTAAGSLGTFAEQVAMSVSATATDESAITYSLANGSTLPSGITLNSASGLISGTLPDVASNTTYTFTINASDGTNTVVPRTFSFISNVAPVWVTSAGSLGAFDEQTSITVSALSATDISDTVTYAIASGSTLPSGLTLNSASGVISGTLPDIASTTTYTFTVNATDGFSTIPREFTITSQLAGPATVDLLIVAGGGGGGGGYYGGGGGAGGLRQLSGISLTSNQLTLTIGNGGAGGTYSNRGTSGQNSSLAIASGTTYSTTGGGGGAGTPGGSGGYLALTGGSGGGGSLYHTYKAGASGNAGGYTPVEGYAGGEGSGYPNSTTSNGGGAGGGGAGGAGESVPGAANKGGQGGIGIYSSITGAAVGYAGGGGGGVWQGAQESGAGAAYGGGRGSPTPEGAGSAGTANTGGGGGAGSGDLNQAGLGSGAAGGSGVIIIAYPDTYRAITTIPGTLTYNQPTRSGYRVYRFTAGSGTVTV